MDASALPPLSDITSWRCCYCNQYNYPVDPNEPAYTANNDSTESFASTENFTDIEDSEVHKYRTAGNSRSEGNAEDTERPMCRGWLDNYPQGSYTDCYHKRCAGCTCVLKASQEEVKRAPWWRIFLSRLR